MLWSRSGHGGGRPVAAGVPLYDADSVLAGLSDVELADGSGVNSLQAQSRELSAEQQDLYAAAGDGAARGPQVEAAGLMVPGQAAEQQVGRLGQLADAAAALAQETRVALGSFVQRPPGAGLWYRVRLGALAVGDVANLTGAMVLLGEIPAVGFLTALGAGVAAVTAGQAGGEIKRVRLAAERAIDPDDVPEALARWRHLFCGAPAGRRPVAVMWGIAAAVVTALTAGVVALRASLDGPLAAVAFGGFTVAVSLGSWWNSYAHADDIADIVDAAEHAALVAGRRQMTAATAPAIGQYHRAVAEAASIGQENTHLGAGAGHGIAATCWGVLARTPLDGVGPGPDGTQPLGRRPRPDGAHPGQLAQLLTPGVADRPDEGVD